MTLPHAAQLRLMQIPSELYVWRNSRVIAYDGWDYDESRRDEKEEEEEKRSE